MPSDVTRDATSTPSALPRGTRLGEFELRQVLGVGGFGIVYLAFDHALEREVAIKEYMPASLVGRTETMHVTLRSQSDAEVFAVGLRSFVNEARMLARFDHPSLLKVHRFWETNGTAYMAMPVLHGKSLKELRQQGAGAPDEAGLRHLLEPLLGAIERLHQEGVYHRDIAPDNIQIEPDGRPVLMDFGAARRVISDKSQHLTAILKPAYAPIEQYAEMPSVKQGPWTDLYALGATVHYLLMGKPPVPSTARAVHDDMRPLSHQEVPGCSVEFLRCIDWMLAPRPGDRPQSVAELREALAGRRVPPHTPLAAPPVNEEDWQTTMVAQRPLAAPPQPDLMLDDDLLRHPPHGAAGAGLGALPAARGAGGLPAPAPSIARVPAPRPAPAPTPAARPLMAAPAAAPKSKLLPLIGGLVVVAGLAIAAAVALWPKPAAVVEATPLPPPSAEPAASVAATAPVAPPVVMPAEAVAVMPSSSAPAVVAAPAAEPAPVREPAPTPPVTAVLTPTPAADPPRAAAPQRPPPSPPPTAARPAPAAAGANPSAQPYSTPVPRRNETVTQPVIEPSRPLVATPPPASPPLAQSPSAQPANPSQAQEPDRGATGPEAICSARGNPVMNFVCMERECLRSRWSNHADCARWRASRPQN